MTDTPNRPPQRLRIRPLPDQERLRYLFRYDDRGLLFWREKVNSQVDLAKPAGYIGPKGYRHVGLNGVMHKHHRLVWCYFNGDPGNLLIDHINYMPGDDRIENLRLATMSENKRDMPAPTTNSSGYKGVSFHKATNKWRAQIKKDGATRHLGYYDSPKEAFDVYVQTAAELYGEYAFAGVELSQGNSND